MARDNVIPDDDAVKGAVRSFIELAISGDLVEYSNLTMTELATRYKVEISNEIFYLDCLLDDYLAIGGPISSYLSSLGVFYDIEVKETRPGVIWMSEKY